MDWKDLPLEHCPRGDEVEMLRFALDRVRQQFAGKTGGLTAEQLRQTHPPSTMTPALIEDPDPAWTSNRRRLAFDLLEEYLRHTGHADVLREAVGGVTGNDPD